MNRISARWRMDARWQYKLTGSSVSLDDVWKWRVIVIACCEEGGYSKLRVIIPISTTITSAKKNYDHESLFVCWFVWLLGSFVMMVNGTSTSS